MRPIPSRAYSRNGGDIRPRPTTSKDVDGRDIGVRKHAVLRTPMPGHDVETQCLSFVMPGYAGHPRLRLCRTNSANAGRPSVSGAFLRELRLEFFHDRRRINAGLLDILGPLFLEGLCGLLPFGDLRGRGLVDLLTG